MSVILGINAYHADSSSCVIKNNELKFAIEEEKINRVKHWAGLPINSIKLGLSLGEIDPKEITDVAVNFNPFSNLFQKSTYFLRNYIIGKKKREIYNRTKSRLDFKKQLFFLENNKFKLHYVDHHVSHIASAFYPSGFDRAVGLSIDGFGDFSSLAIAICDNNRIKINKKIYFPHSLGLFYEAVTQFLGFNYYGDEYKVMGLSSYGKPIYFEKILNNLFKNDELFKLNLDYFNHTNRNYVYDYRTDIKKEKIFSKKFDKLFLKEISNKYKDDFRVDFAASAQKVFEFFLLRIIDYIKKNYQIKNLVFAGGCALNSKANRIIFEKKHFEKIFIPYAPGDGGGSVGAATFINEKKYGNKTYNLRSPYLGQKFKIKKLDLIKSKLAKKGCLIEEYNQKDQNYYDEISKLLKNKKVVGWFQGSIEFGARALGNRSILADPSNPNVKDLINKKIKRRESFRPFAPSIILEDKKIWFDNDYENPYMSFIERINKNKKKIVPGVVHVDDTCRLQTVKREDNEIFYNLINSFKKLTGTPMLLNTSFNENEPIVNEPSEAIDCFLRTDLDVLVIENLIIKKKDQ